MYYLAHLKMKTDLKRRMATTCISGSGKDLNKSRKQLEKKFPGAVILDLNEISEESYWFQQEYLKTLSFVRLHEKLDEYEAECAAGVEEAL